MNTINRSQPGWQQQAISQYGSGDKALANMYLSGQLSPQGWGDYASRMRTQPVGAGTTLARTAPQQRMNPVEGNFMQNVQNGVYSQEQLDFFKAINENPQRWQQYLNSQQQGGAMSPNAPKTGLVGAEDALQRGLTGGLQGIESGVQAASDTLSPYLQGGNGAYNYQAALSGALGQEAQQEAYNRYMASPGQQYLRDQGEQAITRNAAATGQLGGGNVLQELQRHGIGLAAQDFDNAFNRLGSLSQMGYGASQALAGLQGQGGFLGGEMAYNTGNQLANYRTRAGENIADNYASTTSALSNLINQRGTGFADLTGQTGSSLASLLGGYGRDQASAEQALMTLLANIATGSGSQVAGLPGVPGVQQDPGIIDGLGRLLGGTGTLIGAF